MAEVKLGQLAQDKGSNPMVKQFGARMVDDHGKANNKLKQAVGSGMTLPSDVGPKEQATYDKLSKLSGTAFDKAYAADMVKDHQTDISEFQKEASSGKNPTLKSFASETLPVLQDHLKMAKDMQQSVSSSASGASKTASKTSATAR